MDTATYFKLKQELLEHDYYFDEKIYNLSRLFNIYCELEIQNFYDLKFKNHKMFLSFVKENLKLFKSSNIEDPAPIQNNLVFARIFVEQFNILTNPYMEDQLKEEEKWVSAIEKIVGDSKTKILEVGSGYFPCSSILLAQDMNNISSMDEFGVSTKLLSRLNVNGINNFFTSKSSVDDYDLIIGKKACTAIKPIIHQSKPYILELCECDAPNKNKNNWPLYITLFDKKAKISRSGKFVYRLEDRDDLDTIEKILDMTK